jgi:hypothetical protein
MLQAGADEGYRINREVSALSNLVEQPIFEDSTVYELDAKTFGNPPAVTSAGTNSALLPPPRYSNDLEWTNAYHLHIGPMPTLGGFVQVRNDRGQISVPAIGIVDRDTTDTTFNFGVAPTVHIGPSVLTFNSGVQETVRRDSRSPVAMNQNIAVGQNRYGDGLGRQRPEVHVVDTRQLGKPLHIFLYRTDAPLRNASEYGRYPGGFALVASRASRRSFDQHRRH